VTGGIAAVVRREDPAIATGLDGSASSGHAPHVSITTGSRHVTVSRDRTIATVHMARSAAPGEPDADREARLAAEQDRGEVLVAVVRSTATGQVVALYEIRVLSRAGRATGCASPGTSVSVGKRVTCATLPAEGGAVACWGMLQANAVGWFNVSITPTPHNGYIGDETGEAGDAIGRVPFAAWGAAPFVIPSAHFGGGGAIAQAWSHAVSVALGEGWGMALFANGGVRRWGDNTKGQLLTGDANPLADPVAVATAGYMPFGPAGREAFEVRAISAGTLHGCALFSSGAVRCFGFGSSGRTGANAVTDTDTITASELPVVDLGTNTYAIGEISCGAVYTCVVTAATRRPICFGTGSSKRTGLASISNTGDGIGTATSDLAELVVGTGDPECLQINTGAQHACCVVGPRGAAAAGLLGTAAFPRSVRCWGDGGSGRTGRGSTTDVDASLAIDVPMARAGSAQPIQVACGFSHTLIAFTDGTVRGFGVRLYGRTFAGSASISGTIGSAPGQTDAIEAAAGITDVIASVSGPESLMSCLVHADGAIRCGGRDQGAGFAMTGKDPAGDDASLADLVAHPVNLCHTAGATSLASLSIADASGRVLLGGTGGGGTGLAGDFDATVTGYDLSAGGVLVSQPGGALRTTGPGGFYLPGRWVRVFVNASLPHADQHAWSGTSRPAPGAVIERRVRVVGGANAAGVGAAAVVSAAELEAATNPRAGGVVAPPPFELVPHQWGGSPASVMLLPADSIVNVTFAAIAMDGSAGPAYTVVLNTTVLEDPLPATAPTAAAPTAALDAVSSVAVIERGRKIPVSLVPDGGDAAAPSATGAVDLSRGTIAFDVVVTPTGPGVALAVVAGTGGCGDPAACAPAWPHAPGFDPTLPLVVRGIPVPADDTVDTTIVIAAAAGVNVTITVSVWRPQPRCTAQCAGLGASRQVSASMVGVAIVCTYHVFVVVCCAAWFGLFRFFANSETCLVATV
jgi:alpha-tubulin suppressor-like RCC1 family protein